MEAITPLLGGALIGLSVTIMLLFNGRITGISGILNGVLTPQAGDTLWRAVFLLGLLAGGLLLQLFAPGLLKNTLDSPHAMYIIGGFLVGFGTVLGSGCTSGHGVCGISRLSPRSISATLSFMLLGVITVYVLRHLLGGF